MTRRQVTNYERAVAVWFAAGIVLAIYGHVMSKRGNR